MRKSIILGAVLLCAVGSWAADATFDIKPGLWTITNTVLVSGLPPIANLDKMSPEQRARIEAVMKNMTGSPHANTVQSCVTRENIQKEIAKANSVQGNTCDPKLVSVSASKVVLHIHCTQENGDTKSNGDVTIERQDSEHFKGTGAIKSAGPNGRDMDVKLSMTGAFVSSDCGKVKPFDQ